MQPRRPLARVGLLAVAAALMAVLVAAPSAGAAQFGKGPIKLDFKASKLKVAMVGQDTKTDTKTGGTFPFADEAGSVTMTSQPSGNLLIGGTSAQITLTHANKKKIVLKSFVEKLAAGKGQLTAKINGKGGAVAFFDEATTNKLKVASDFSTLSLETASMTLTSKGAAALNKAFGLKKPAPGKKDLRLKAKQKFGTAGFTAQRLLTITGGESRLIYNPAFVQKLRDCGITLHAVAPGQEIPKDPATSPEGGVILPANNGQLNAVSFFGTINNGGGTLLERPEGAAGKGAYSSELKDFVYAFSETQNILSARVVNLDLVSPIGSVSGVFATTLTDTGGSFTLSNGSLNLSEGSATLLGSKAEKIGADCPLEAGIQIGSFVLTGQVT